MVNKKMLVKIMLIMRMLLFIMIAIIGCKLYSSVFSSWQFMGVLFLLIIVLDIYDGKLARATEDSIFIFKHRCLDGVVDKIGNIIALIGFLGTGRIGQSVFVLLAMRELLLLLLGGWAFFNNQIEHIRGDYYGKIYYLLLALFVFLNFPSNIKMVHPSVNMMFLFMLCVLMIINLGTHGLPFVRKMSGKLKRVFLDI